MKTIILPLAAMTFGAVQLLAQPVITTQPTNQIILNGSNALFSVAVSGTGPFAYQWQFTGTNLPNNIITTVEPTCPVILVMVGRLPMPS